MSHGVQLIQQPMSSTVMLVPAPLEPANNITITEDTHADKQCGKLTYNNMSYVDIYLYRLIMRKTSK